MHAAVVGYIVPVEVDESALVVEEINRGNRRADVVILQRLAHAAVHVPLAGRQAELGELLPGSGVRDGPMREEAQFLLSGGGHAQLAQNIIGAFASGHEGRRNPNARAVARHTATHPAVIQAAQPAFNVLEGGLQRGQAVIIAAGVTGGSGIEGFVRAPVPVLIGRRRQGGRWVGQSPIVRADGRTVERNSPLNALHGGGFFSLAQLRVRRACPQYAGGEVVVTLDAQGGLISSRAFDGGDELGEVFKVVAHVESCIVGERPLAEGEHGHLQRFKSPLDGFAEDQVRIHAHVETAVTDQGLEQAVVQEAPVAVGLGRQHGALPTVGQHLGPVGRDAPDVMLSDVENLLIGSLGQRPGNRPGGNVGGQAVVAGAGKVQVQGPVLQGVSGAVQAHLRGQGKVAARGAVGVASKGGGTGEQESARLHVAAQGRDFVIGNRFGCQADDDGVTGGAVGVEQSAGSDVGVGDHSVRDAVGTEGFFDRFSD